MATLDLTPEPLEIIAKRSVTWEWTITWQDSAGNPINNTGYTFTWTAYKDDGTTLLSVATGSGITNGGATGTIAFLIPATSTGVDALTYTWRLIGTAAGKTYCPAEGTLVVENP